MFNSINQNTKNKIQLKNQNKANDYLDTHREYNKQSSSLFNLNCFTVKPVLILAHR